MSTTSTKSSTVPVDSQSIARTPEEKLAAAKASLGRNYCLNVPIRPHATKPKNLLNEWRASRSFGELDDC